MADPITPITPAITPRHGFLARLGRDERGNTFAIVGAAMIALAAMMGSGVDMSRAYMAKLRLQQACDAASLAGRRAMTGDVINTAVTTEVNKFFNFNFPQGMYNTAAFTPVVTKPQTGTLRITASTSIPTAIMKLFGFTSIALDATCDASQSFINADVLLVLDTTGSMNDPVGGTKKIVALRKAVMSLYDQLKPSQDFLGANGYRLRYGVVPYSSTVNVGKLLWAQNNAFIRRPGTYTQSTSFTCTRTNGAGECIDGDFTLARNAVTRDVNWINNTWPGCIEERQTFPIASSSPSASDRDKALDLNIDLVPTSDLNTKWQPYDPASQSAKFGEACPSKAVRLKTWDRASLETYVNGLVPNGATYHDIGMIWGARLLSAAGVFGDSPPNFNGMRTNKYLIFLTDGELAPSTHVYGAYGTEWADGRVTGRAWSNTRRYSNTTGLGSQFVRHEARFTLACQAARQLGASIWVIGLDTTLTSAVSNCANPGQSSVAGSEAQLIARFSEIGKDISELRLTQ